ILLGRGPGKEMAMIISMKKHATRAEIDAVTKQVNHFGYKVHSIEGEERVVIGVVGVGDVTACLESIEAMPQVENVMRISAPYKFVSKEFRKEKTRICVDGKVIGGDEFVVIAGPCSVESEEQILRSAEGVGKMWPANFVEARAKQHGEGIIDERGIYRGARKSRRDAVRARNSHIRNSDAEYLRHHSNSRIE